jgi:hypothetical protein
VPRYFWVVPDFVQKDWHELLSASVAILLLGPQSVIAFAVSMSLTRYIGAQVGRLCNGAARNAFSFSLLLVLHIALFVYWSRVVTRLEMLPVALLVAIAKRSSEVLSGYASESFADLASGSVEPDWWSGWYYSDPTDWNAKALKGGLDIVANGIRILFALAFLTSFVFRPLIQEPISRLWYGAMDSGKPVFTTLFGILGAVVAAVQFLVK